MDKKNINPTSHKVNDCSSSEIVKKFVPRAPFPQRLKTPQENAKFDDILEEFQQVQINIPLIDTIQQVPAYAKFLKDIVTIKRKNNIPKKTFLIEQLVRSFRVNIYSNIRTWIPYTFM